MQRTFITDASGEAPAVALVNPKYPDNIGKVLRNCSVFGIRQLWVTGDRALDSLNGTRLPREERMRAYGDVQLCRGDYFFDAFPSDVTPIAVEVRQNSERLGSTFIHPDKALYVFGPEDGGLGKMYLRHCHRFVIIPTQAARPLNMAVATGIVLAHRYLQRVELGLEHPDTGPAQHGDHRGFVDDPAEALAW